MIVSSIKKNILCVFLSFLLVFSSAYTTYNKAESFDFVLTPAITGYLITSLVACGIIVSQTDVSSVVSTLWSNSSSNLKNWLTKASTYTTFVADGLVSWSSSAWSDFTNMIKSLFSSSGGSLAVASFGGYNFELNTTHIYFSNISSSAFVNLPDQDGVHYFSGEFSEIEGLFFNATWEYNSSYTNRNKLQIDYYINFFGLGDCLIFSQSRPTYDQISLNKNLYLLLPELFLNGSYPYLSSRMSTKDFKLLDYFIPYYDSSTDTTSIYYENFGESYLVDNVLGVNFVKNTVGYSNWLCDYFTGATSSTVDYVCDELYFPTSDTALKVDENEIITFPTINDVTMGDTVFSNVNTQTLPLDYPNFDDTVVVPPVTDTDSIFDILSGILDWLSSILESLLNLPYRISEYLLSMLQSLFITDALFFETKFNDLLIFVNDKLGNVTLDYTNYSAERVIEDIYITLNGKEYLIFSSKYIKQTINIFRPWIIGLLGLLALFFNYKNVIGLFNGFDIAATSENERGKK